MAVEDTIKRYKPLKNQLSLFTKNVDHLEVPFNFCLSSILDSRTLSGNATDVHVLYIKTQQDIEDVISWIKDVYSPELLVNMMPYLFTKEYFVFWKSNSNNYPYCHNLGSLIEGLKEDLNNLMTIANTYKTA